MEVIKEKLFMIFITPIFKMVNMKIYASSIKMKKK